MRLQVSVWGWYLLVYVSVPSLEGEKESQAEDEVVDEESGEPDAGQDRVGVQKVHLRWAGGTEKAEGKEAQESRSQNSMGSEAGDSKRKSRHQCDDVGQGLVVCQILDSEIHRRLALLILGAGLGA